MCFANSEFRTHREICVEMHCDHLIIIPNYTRAIKTHKNNILTKYLNFLMIFSDCRVVRDPQTLKSKGYGFVSFAKKTVSIY